MFTILDRGKEILYCVVKYLIRVFMPLIKYTKILVSPNISNITICKIIDDFKTHIIILTYCI